MFIIMQVIIIIISVIIITTIISYFCPDIHKTIGQSGMDKRWTKNAAENFAIKLNVIEGVLKGRECVNNQQNSRKALVR